MPDPVIGGATANENVRAASRQLRFPMIAAFPQASFRPEETSA